MNPNDEVTIRNKRTGEVRKVKRSNLAEFGLGPKPVVRKTAYNNPTPTSIPQTNGTNLDLAINLIKTYFPQDQWQNAYNIMMQESGGKNVPSTFNQYGGEDSHGLFQINLMAHPQMAGKVYDPKENIKYAAQLYKARGNWDDWYNSAKRLGLT